MSSDANNEAAEPSAESPETSAPEASGDGASSAPSAPLPSIIVDPSIDDAGAADNTGVASATEAPTTNGPAAGDGADPSLPESHASDDEGAWSVGAMSEFDADRFAESLRPSWEAPALRDQGSWSPGASPVTPSGTRTDAFTSSRSSSPDSLPPPVIARGLDRRMLAGIAAGALVILLTLWSLIGGEPEAPPSWNGQTGPSKTASPEAPPAASSSQTPPAPTSAASAPSVVPTSAPATSAAAPTTAPEPPQAPAPTPTPTAPPPAPAAPKSVHVRISTVPASADLTLDGDAIPNPFDAWVAAGGARAIVARADGYAERTWSVSFDQDQTLSLVLKRDAAPPPPRRPARPRPAQRKPAKKPRGAGFVTDNPY